MPSSDLALAERLAREAGELLLDRFGGPAQGVDWKSSETERPDDGLLAEEGSADRSSSGRRWVIDPLDGTVNYLYGIPQWCVSIALEDGDGAAVAVVCDPSRGETFTARRGGGAFLGGEPIRVRQCDRLEIALIATGFGYDPERRARQARIVSELLPRARDIRRAGSAALDLAWLAAGRLDGYYERGLNPWDWAAARLIVEEAGGLTREMRGEPLGLVAACPDLVPELEELVSGW